MFENHIVEEAVFADSLFHSIEQFVDLCLRSLQKWRVRRRRRSRFSHVDILQNGGVMANIHNTDVILLEIPFESRVLE